VVAEAKRRFEFSVVVRGKLRATTLECMLMTWIEMPFLSTSSCDVTAPSQFHSTIVRQRTTTALGYVRGAIHVAVTGSSSSLVNGSSLRRVICSREREKWKAARAGPSLWLETPPINSGVCHGRRRRQHFCESRSSERGRKQPSSTTGATPQGDTN
jgi:hypothetical protein